MTKEIFENRYNRKNYLDFLQYKILPDDFKKYTQQIKLPRTYRFLKKLNMIGECKSLDLIIIEASIYSKMNPHYLPSKEILSILDKYLYSNAVLLTIPIKGKHYRMSLIKSLLKLKNQKVIKINEIIKTKSLYLGTKFKKKEMINHYTPLLRETKINTIEDLNSWFIESHKLTFYKPVYRPNRLWMAFQKYMAEKPYREFIERLPYIENPFLAKFECLNESFSFEEYDDEIIPENQICDPGEEYIKSAYYGYENYIKGNYFEAIDDFNNALQFNISETAEVYSTLAKCYYYENDFDNFIKFLTALIEADDSYIDSDHIHFFHQIIEQMEVENEETL